VDPADIRITQCKMGNGRPRIDCFTEKLAVSSCIYDSKKAVHDYGSLVILPSNLGQCPEGQNMHLGYCPEREPIVGVCGYAPVGPRGKLIGSGGEAPLKLKAV